MEKAPFFCKIQKISTDEKRYVEGVVYAPNELDTHQAMMLPQDIETMAHRFLKDVVLKNAIDVGHSNEASGSYPVISYLAKKNDPDGYPEGAWVLGVKIATDDLWEKVKKGEIAGYSFEAWVTKQPAVVTIEYLPQITGETEINEEHTHLYFVNISEVGRVVNGMTDVVNGHSHVIKSATATEESAGHAHRYFL